MRLDGTRPLNAADAPKRLAQNFRFIANLRLVRHVLVLAAAAAPKVRARGAMRSGEASSDLGQTPANEFFLPSGGFDSNQFAGQDQRHEYGLAVMMRQTVTAIHKFFNSNFHLESLSDAGGAHFRPGPQVR